METNLLVMLLFAQCYRHGDCMRRRDEDGICITDVAGQGQNEIGTSSSVYNASAPHADMSYSLLSASTENLTLLKDLYSTSTKGQCGVLDLPKLRMRFRGSALKLLLHLAVRGATKDNENPELEYKAEDECEDNVLWLVGDISEADRAFEFDAYACYELLRWSEVSCSVVVKTVKTNEQAKAVLGQYSNDTIRHLTFAGHGQGHTLSWKRHWDFDDEAMSLLSSSGREVINLAAAKMKAGGSVHMNSCYSATFHAEECLAHGVSRLMGKNLYVTGHVFSFVAKDLDVSIVDAEDEDGEVGDNFHAVCVRGTRVFKHHDIQISSPVAGDWAHFNTGWRSTSSQRGVVSAVNSTSCTIHVLRKAETLNEIPQLVQFKVPLDLIIRVIKPGDDVFRVPAASNELIMEFSFDIPRPSAVYKFLVADFSRPAGQWFLLQPADGGPISAVTADELWPIGQQPHVTGPLFPEAGDLVCRAKDPEAGKSYHELKRGQRDVGVIVNQGAGGAEVLWSWGAIMARPIAVEHILKLAKPGQTVFHDDLGQGHLVKQTPPSEAQRPLKVLVKFDDGVHNVDVNAITLS